MKFYQAENYEDMSRNTDENITEQIKSKHNCVRGSNKI